MATEIEKERVEIRIKYSDAAPFDLSRGRISLGDQGLTEHERALDAALGHYFRSSTGYGTAQGLTGMLRIADWDASGQALYQVTLEPAQWILRSDHALLDEPFDLFNPPNWPRP